MAMINTGLRFKVQDANDAPLTPYNLPLTTGSRGFALLIAVIFTSVMLTLGLALSSLGYKQQVLASSAIASQYAFYAADAALECALYADQRQNRFAYSSNLSAPVPTMTCDGFAPYFASTILHTNSVWVMFNRVSLDSGRCADVTVYKYRVPQGNGVLTYIFSQGYNAACDSLTGLRVVARGINISY